MSHLEIRGGVPLSGRLRVQGAKNSVLPILAAALLAPGQSVLHNCPDLSDVAATGKILRLLGCGVEREEKTLLVDASQPTGCAIPDPLMREMRSSVIFLGAMLARLGRAELSYPGGCELGPRPIDLHLAALRSLGAEIVEEQGRLRCTVGRGLVGRELCLSIPSVGATENAMLAACGARGTTTIVGAAREPEIVDLQNFLNAMGGRVSGAGSPVVLVEGEAPLHPAEYTVMGDRILVLTSRMRGSERYFRLYEFFRDGFRWRSFEDQGDMTIREDLPRIGYDEARELVLQRMTESWDSKLDAVRRWVESASEAKTRRKVQ